MKKSKASRMIKKMRQAPNAMNVSNESHIEIFAEGASFILDSLS